MPPKKNQPSVTQNVTGDNNVVIAGNENTVNQTIIQKFFNIFKSDAETVERRNRRIMLGHVENFWVKGILEKSLHGAALLELGIKEDPDALTYPWAIKREATKETLPAGTSLLDIFQEIGMGRSLLILGAPGSGKTTMLLELTRQLIERACEDVTEPIPVVFNLSSWRENLTLADWLARELNVIYTIPIKLAPTWVKENKMLLLLDGLDEVRQESRDKCVDAINQFRKENGLTSMAVCSRIQDYAELKSRLSFDGAIEIQPLTPDQVKEYFKRLGSDLTSIRKVLENDALLREMAETPLFLSIMTLAYRDMAIADILVSKNVDEQRKHLFDTYIERMFTRPERSKYEIFKKRDVMHWLSWLACKMSKYNAVPYFIEQMQPEWLDKLKTQRYMNTMAIISALLGGLNTMLIFGLMGWFLFRVDSGWMKYAILLGLFIGVLMGLARDLPKIETVDTLTWNWKREGDQGWDVLLGGVLGGLFFGFIVSTVIGASIGVSIGMCIFLIMLMTRFGARQLDQIVVPGQKLFSTVRISLFLFLLFGFSCGLIFTLSSGLIGGLLIGLAGGLFVAIFWAEGGGFVVLQHYCLRSFVTFSNNLPWRLIPFLDHCVDLIFLRRVGGGYIFVHRLLMEHFADMYTADEK